ncbi:NAD(P)/FAD-dependent oxidoreductase [Paraferrimonas sp. SM1919]|uniref:NAD(P)/FAD-dependent oxidoreductase n=1 Tax=Paraferrimonas sp. SM1919 TaxID=2662263 RepID=UPI0013D71748|nr:NAD(P)/FAD-dependent oxidoreductase [Paraferrimonas sp. SM1919]
MQTFDTIIIGAGAAGLMCAATSGYQGCSVLVLDNAKKSGRKILISGGGKSNFTNTKVEPNHFVCSNPHFVKSALARYPSTQFIELVERHGLQYEERDHGQLFCLNSAQDLLNILLTECEWAGCDIRLRHEIIAIEHTPNGFVINTSEGEFCGLKLVIATGGLSMPKLGATPFGYQVAEQFGHSIIATRAGLVPFTLQPDDKQNFATLSGISLPVTIQAQRGPSFDRDLLFTHRGLSGPAVLQISNYWVAGEVVTIDLLPNQNVIEILNRIIHKQPKLSTKNALSNLIPKRLVEALIDEQILVTPIAQLGKTQLQAINDKLHQLCIKPGGTEGYRTAEVTLGGVNTDEISSKNMESKLVPGLFFIGEVLDVTGWLGGFNFQWAWASGVACGLAQK